MAEVVIPVNDNADVPHRLGARRLLWQDDQGVMEIQHTTRKIVKLFDQASLTSPLNPLEDGFILNENFDVNDIPATSPPGTGMGDGPYEEYVRIVGLQIGINGPATPPKMDVVMMDSANWQSIFQVGDEAAGLNMDEYVTLQVFRVRALADIDDPTVAGTHSWYTNHPNSHSVYIPCDIRARWLDDWPPCPVLLARETVTGGNYTTYGVFIEG